MTESTKPTTSPEDACSVFAGMDDAFFAEAHRVIDARADPVASAMLARAEKEARAYAAGELCAKEPPEMESGVDRWTSNGYGIVSAPLTDEQKERIAEVNAEFAAQQTVETDGTFFDDLRRMERRILTEKGDTEALDILDAELAAQNEED